MSDWQDLLAHAVGREPIPNGFAVRFPEDLELSSEVARLASAEQNCCRFFDFSLHVTGEHLDLQLTGPAAAQPVMTTVFGVPRELMAESTETTRTPACPIEGAAALPGGRRRSGW